MFDLSSQFICFSADLNSSDEENCVSHLSEYLFSIWPLRTLLSMKFSQVKGRDVLPFLSFSGYKTFRA